MSDEAELSLPGAGGPPTVLLCADDLMLAVRVEAAAGARGYRLVALDGIADLAPALAAARPRAVVLDLTSPGFPLERVLAAVRGAEGAAPPVLAFYPHVLKDVGRAARAAGCDLVVPRSQFMTDMPALLERLVQRDPRDAVESATVDE